MEIRQTLNENPGLTTGVTAAVMSLALIVVLWQGCAGPRGGRGGSGKAYFSADDGKSFFADDATRVPPFRVHRPGHGDHGKLAVRAQVFQCGEGEPFVWVLEKYEEPERKKLEAAVSARGPRVASAVLMHLDGLLVKRPGGTARSWVKLSARTRKRYAEVVTPVCPSGGNDRPARVLPR